MSGVLCKWRFDGYVSSLVAAGNEFALIQVQASTSLRNGSLPETLQSVVGMTWMLIETTMAVVGMTRTLIETTMAVVEVTRTAIDTSKAVFEMTPTVAESKFP